MSYRCAVASKKPREQRRIVLVPGRMRRDSGWSDVTICNLSSRGLMARCENAPPRGAFIEVRRGTSCIVGQVRWSHGTFFGVQARERIDIPSVLEQTARESAASAERRTLPRDDAKPAKRAPRSEEDSRRWAHMFEWLTIAAVGLVLAGFVVSEVHSVLSAPLAEARNALAR